MSYDIYGNLLHQGHCEVHPHVHEEYPCSVCIQESNNRNTHKQSESDHYEIMRLEHELYLSQQRIEELEVERDSVCHLNDALSQERDELAATVDRLRVFANAVVECVPDTPENHWIYPTVQTLKHCLKTTPRQNLAENDAEVVVRAVNKYKLRVVDGPDIYSDALIEYANQLKRGEL